MYSENPFLLYWPALAEAMAGIAKENIKKGPAEKAGRGEEVLKAGFFPGGRRRARTLRRDWPRPMSSGRVMALFSARLRH